MYKAFISWSSEDPCIKPFATVFKDSLNLIFGENISFFISTEISPGRNGIAQFHQELKQADFGFFFISQRTANSPWVLYEYGYLNNELDDGNVFTFLCDLTIEKLKTISPPFGERQAVSINNSDDFNRVVEALCNKINLKELEKTSILSKAKDRFGNIKKGLDEIKDTVTLLPDKYTGSVYYSDTINCSNTFTMPNIFKIYKKDLFLVGINLNFLLNLKMGKAIFNELIDNLIENENKKVKILISNLWEPSIGKTYDYICNGKSNMEMDGLNEVFNNKDSDIYIDKYIRKRCDDSIKYNRITKQLEIKTIDMLMDTFWFVDTDIGDISGNMMMIPMTASSGKERPVYYLSYTKNKSAYNSYYSICSAGYENWAKCIWPI